jgi:hypothetical protein
VSSLLQVLSKFSLLHVLVCAAALAQEPAAKPGDSASPSEKAAAAKSEEKAALPFQIQLLETHVRFESNGDSRKEVHTVVKINDLAGARQFSRLGFDYNRAFQQVEIPLMKISHVNGGTSEILPSAITDAPNPAVQDFPAYHDVRVKSVRILGLQDGDTIEYRVITTTTKHPLAPDFWLEHTFDRSGQVAKQLYELEFPSAPFEESESQLAARVKREEWGKESPIILPWKKSPLSTVSRTGRIYVSPGAPKPSVERMQDGSTSRLQYKWTITSGDLKQPMANAGATAGPDVVITTYSGWQQIGWAFNRLFYSPMRRLSKDTTIWQKRRELVGAKDARTVSEEETIYEFVSRKIKTVDLSLELTGFRPRPPSETLVSGYGTSLDKVRLMVALLNENEPLTGRGADCGWVPDLVGWEVFQLPRPSLFSQLLLRVYVKGKAIFLDPSLQVAPFGMIPAALRGRHVFIVPEPPQEPLLDIDNLFSWEKIPEELPFAAAQKVSIDASIGVDGTLISKVRYSMRGDNELLLRVAFHQTPKERWKEVAGLLALSDGFRGSITNVTASDPMAAKEPFTVEYEVTQAKFVDWSKKPVRIPALLPQIVLPDAPGKTGGEIELGTPLDVQTSLRLQLPEGTTVQTPAATSVARDYATFASKYEGHLNTVTASRHIHFVMREIPIERAADYNAFLRAAQNDQAQTIVLLPPAAESGVK